MPDRLPVIRTRCGHMRVGVKWFRLRDLGDAAHARLVAGGSDNPGFDMPPFFRSGAPYGEQLLALGCPEVSPPASYAVEWVPQFDHAPWRARLPIWPRIFGVNQKEPTDD
jgi:hypothetical protein